MKNARHPRYARHRFPAEVISHAVSLYFRFPLSVRMVEEILAAQIFANQIRCCLPAPRAKWHLDEVVISIAGKRHWL
jgi:putative transposase